MQSRSMRQFGMWGVIALIALRLGVGWHFFKEGTKKFTDAGVPTVAFLRSAKGPLSETYKRFIPDRYGHKRLSEKETIRFYRSYKDRVARHYGFDADQAKKADKIADRYVARMRNFLRGNREDMREYFLEVDRLNDLRTSDPARKVPFQRGRIADKENELWGTSATWLADVRTLSVQFQRDLENVATEAQRSRGVYRVPDRSKPALIDTTIKVLVTAVGVLLILGLFSRAASVGGILFLGSVLSTQPPWVDGANTQFFYYQLVEVFALFLLFVFVAGRFGGLDYLIHGLYSRCCPPKTHQL